jgi:hypothetical protein
MLLLQTPEFREYRPRRGVSLRAERGPFALALPRIFSQADDLGRAQFTQTVWKVGLCGFLCRAWRGRIQHDTHFWIRTFANLVVAGGGGRLVGADNPVWFIDALVDELDLSAAGFVRVAAKATGRPGYAPAEVLKLYIYGYLNRVRSSRRLEMESHRNIEPFEVSSLSHNSRRP